MVNTEVTDTSTWVELVFITEVAAVDTSIVIIIIITAVMEIFTVLVLVVSMLTVVAAGRTIMEAVGICQALVLELLAVRRLEVLSLTAAMEISM